MTELSAHDAVREQRHLWWLMGAGALFLGLRLAGMLTTQPLFNQDSINYLEWAATFRAWDWHGIVNMDPDAAPLYSFLTALFSYLTGDMVLAARLLSLLASLAAAAAAWVLAYRLANRAVATLCVLILAVNPHFIRFSFAEMTEMLYIAIFAWIVVIVGRDIRNPRPRNALLLGLLGGCAFLTKVEAVLLLPAIPALYWFFALLWNRTIDKRTLLVSNLLLIVVMTALAAPQVARVSHQMHSFALNGRVAWTRILTVPDGRSYNEKLSGLDYDPHTINLVYLQEHPEALDRLVASRDSADWLKAYLGTAARNLKEMHDYQLGHLAGLPLLAFALIGLLALLRAGLLAEVSIVVAFLLVALVAPVTYMVTERHLLILLPLIALFGAVGIRESYDMLSQSTSFARVPPAALAGLLIAAALSAPVLELSFRYVRPDLYDNEYSIGTLREPLAILKSRAGDPDHPATVMSRKSFLPYLAGARREIPPYTDLPGLLRYMEGRDVDYLYFEERYLDEYPFAREVGSEAWQQHFDELHSLEYRGRRLVLYALR